MIRFNFLIISDHSERPQQDNEHQHPDPQPDRGVHVNRTRPELLFHSRVWISLMLTFPVLLFSSIIQDLLAFSIPVFIGNKLIMPIFSIVIFLYGLRTFRKMTVAKFQKRRPGMMMLISLAISVSFVYNLVALFFDPDSGLFGEATILIDIVLLGYWLKMRRTRQLARATSELIEHVPATTERIPSDGRQETVFY